MTDSWKEWEGRTVDGKFVLENYLGGSEAGGIFRTRVGSGLVDGSLVESGKDAAIKLVALGGAEAESQLRRWQAASELSHPNLIRILKTGRCAADGRELVFAVEEFAEENLAQIVPERALAAEEVRGMLAPVLVALEFVHGRGFAHGRIQPSNILAAGDQVKLSSDSLRRTGDVPRTISPYDAPEVVTAGISPASDVWSLGMTLVEVLTQRAPAWDPARMTPPEIGQRVPEPFREIARLCLQVDPAKRPGVREIANRLEEKRTAGPGVKPAPVNAISASARKRANGPYLLVLAAALVVTIFLIVRPRPSSGPDEARTSSAAQQTSSSQTSSSQTSSSQTSPSQTSSSPAQARQTAPAEPPRAQPPTSAVPPGADQKAVATDDIVERAMPQVSPSARRTISGKLKVRVRVEVDAAGNVTEARLKDAGPSQYFARVALEAARHWKFAPAPDEKRTWILLFAFTRARTETSATRAR